MNIRTSIFIILGIFIESSLFSFTVHVLLDKKTDEGTLWTIKSSQGVFLSDPFNNERKDKVTSKKIVLRQEKGQLFVGGKRLAVKHIKIEPIAGELEVHEEQPDTKKKQAAKRYPGALLVLPENGVWHFVNSVDLEDYVCSVLRSESWPGWPLEVNKAFAIMQRSYAVAKITQARGKKKLGKGFLYDIGCTNLDQTYQGAHDHAHLRQAVEETKGIVLAHKKKPIMAMYDVCCGGLIPAKMEGIDFVGSPYLARSYPCTFCTNCKVYSWKATYSLQECTELFKTLDETMAHVLDMKIAATDKAGVVKEVKVKHGKQWQPFSRKKIYALFKDVKSYSFDVKRRSGSLVFTGRGYGHHLGLCQWGARQMVEEGWSYPEILDFYYPGTNFMKLVS